MEYTENYLKSIDEAVQDDAFVEKLVKAENAEQIRALFRNEKGIELEGEAAQEAFNKLEYIRNGGELSAEDLEDAAGGCLFIRRPRPWSIRPWPWGRWIFRTTRPTRRW